MAEPAPKRMTVAEFLRWDAPGDARYELIGGCPVAMAPGKRSHGAIVANMAMLVGNALRARRPGCTVHTEAGIVLPNRNDTWYVADLAVTCRRHSPGETHIPDPVLIVEVLSASTWRHDSIGKLPHYRLFPSVQEIVLIDSERLACIVHCRFERTRWLTDILTAPEQPLVLESCGFDQPLAEVYAGVVLADEERGSENG